MRIDKEEHRQFLLELLGSPSITVPLAVAEVVVEVKKAVQNATVEEAE